MNHVLDTTIKNVFHLNQSFESCVLAAVKLLQFSQVIALPTDTIYGLAANAQCGEAVKRVYAIKGRHLAKPLAICVSEVKDIKKWGNTSHLPSKLLAELLPGPVTIVLHRTELLNPQLNSGTQKVGIRIPNSEFIRRLTAVTGFPLALTSANKSNETSPLAVEEFSALWPQLAAVFDGGRIGEDRAGSTIVDLTLPGKYQIVRKGSDFDATISVLHKYNITWCSNS